MKELNSGDSKKIIVALIIAVTTFFYVLTGNEDIIFWEKDNDIDKHVYRVERVIDGDTFVIEGGERVRMIGIDTPERGQVYYQEAKEYLGDFIDGQEVRLEKDQSETDRYSRLLRHVYIGDQWINKKMIEDGYARFVTFPPDVAHVEAFQFAEKSAREKEYGLWSIKE